MDAVVGQRVGVTRRHTPGVCCAVCVSVWQSETGWQIADFGECFQLAPDTMQLQLPYVVLGNQDHRAPEVLAAASAPGPGGVYRFDLSAQTPFAVGVMLAELVCRQRHPLGDYPLRWGAEWRCPCAAAWMCLGGKCMRVLA